MTLSGFQALCVLAVFCALFLRFGTFDDDSSPDAGTAGSQGERSGDDPIVAAAYRPER